MESSKTVRKWSELYRLNVTIPGEGKIAGTVEDFYLQEGTNAIYALSVRTRLYGDLSLPVSGIESIEAGEVTIVRAQMLLKAVPPFTLGQSLPGRKVLGEDGKELGSIKDIIFGIEPVSALRVAAYEISQGKHQYVVGADAVAGYEEGTITLHEQSAKKLR